MIPENRSWSIVEVMKWLFLFLSAIPLFGAYVGNPASPALMNTGFFSASYPFCKITTGYLADYTSDKRFEAQQKDPNFDPNQAFRRFGLHSQQATVSIIFVERLEVFGSAGGTKERAKWVTKPTVSDMTEVILDFQSAHHFSWSAGGKVVLLQWWQTYLSADFTYFAVPSSSKSYFKYLNRLNIPLDFSKHKFNLREWQLSLGLSSRFYFITPYGGATYLHSRLHVNEGPEFPSLNYRNQDKLGYFYGVTLSLTGRFHLNFERRVRDEFGYSFSTTAVF